MVDKKKLIDKTLEYGFEFGLNHSNRILHLVSELAQGKQYDEDAVWIAAHLHDWGGYAPWLTPGVDHVVRSVEVAGEYLAAEGCEPELAELVIECIKYHHGGPAERSFESKLFADADAIELLGAMGFARVFSMNHRNLKTGIAALEKFREMSIAAISLDQSRAIAEKRVAEMDAMIKSFREQSFGLL